MTDEATAPRPATRWLVVAVAILAVAAVAFAIGRFSAFGASAAPVRPSTVSAEAGFARDMQVHHEQAIRMAMDIYRVTDDDELRILAHDMATAQAGQRGEMFGWLVEWGLPQAGGPLMSWMADSSAHQHDPETATEDELRADMGMATDAQLAELESASEPEADCLFLSLMIRHHQGAIPMAEAVVELGEDPRVRTVAESMISAQTSEIDAMRSMQTRLACTG
ncbi:DUF305 domain-containing protein [Microbacterium sp. P06]|uniref:DUF305 domain-containing protein n=1 Tax=unclassified Microbacterium TaxID=2609290 RepID=UPI003746D13D